jgi:hypothetical protein
MRRPEDTSVFHLQLSSLFFAGGIGEFVELVFMFGDFRKVQARSLATEGHYRFISFYSFLSTFSLFSTNPFDGRIICGE